MLLLMWVVPVLPHRIDPGKDANISENIFQRLLSQKMQQKAKIIFLHPGSGLAVIMVPCRPRRWLEMVDIFEKITGKIVELLEAGTVPWRQPWSGAVPTNLSSMKPYNGINFLLLVHHNTSFKFHSLSIGQ